MTFSASVKTCLRKYIAFSGRASRSEYWWFFLFCLVAGIFLALLDEVLFGADTYRAETTETSFRYSTEIDGPLATVFSLATFIPMLAAGWRRMHDSGRAGLYLLYPLIAMLGLGMFIGLFGVSDAQAAETSTGLFDAILVLSIIAIALSPFLVIWWLTRPSQPGPNTYGPNPHEVTP